LQNLYSGKIVVRKHSVDEAEFTEWFNQKFSYIKYFY
jgi:hypothetical protein